MPTIQIHDVPAEPHAAIDAAGAIVIGLSAGDFPPAGAAAESGEMLIATGGPGRAAREVAGGGRASEGVAVIPAMQIGHGFRVPRGSLDTASGDPLIL